MPRKLVIFALPPRRCSAATPEVGRFFSEEEERGRDKVAVLGTTVRQLFGDFDPIEALRYE